jgi:hypothetical protein
MRSSMFNRKSLFVIAVITVLVGTMVAILPRLSGSDSAKAQQGYTLRGRYAFYTAAGSPVEAALGSIVTDGAGNVTGGSLKLNLPRAALFPGTTGRTSVDVAVTGGSFQIAADGTGFASTTITLPGQAPQPRDYDFLVVTADGNVVTEARMAQQQQTTSASVFAYGLGYYAIRRLSD